MIVTTAEDVVRLSGALVKNQWLTIKAAANLLMQNHPEGIIINCAELSHVSEDGAKTFLEAMKDIQSAGARIMVCNLPDNVLQVIRSVPGVRSQLPLANSEEEARASLRLGGAAPSADSDRPPAAGGVIVPLLPGLDVEHALMIAGRVAKEHRAQIHLVYVMEVARNLPLTSALCEEEGAAQSVLNQALQHAKRQNVLPTAHVERVRDVVEGLLHALKT